MRGIVIVFLLSLLSSAAAQAYEGWRGPGWYAPSPADNTVLLMGPYKNEKTCERQSGVPRCDYFGQPPMASRPAPPAHGTANLAGVWSGWSDCPFAQPYELYVAALAPDQYRVTGGANTGSLNGWIAGGHSHFEAQMFLNHQVWEGGVDSPTSMSGTVVNSLGAICRWQATKR